MAIIKDFGNLKELNTYANKIMEVILSSDKLANLIYYKDLDALDKTPLSMEDKIKLLYNNIFPYKVVSKLSETAQVYVMTTFRNIRKDYKNNQFKSCDVLFYVLCHPDIMRINEGLRYYAIMSELDTLFNNQKILGIGRMSFENADEIIASDNYSGYFMTFNVLEFNK